MRIVRLLGQLTLLSAVYGCGALAVRLAGLPLPGGVVGMGVLLLLLGTGVVPVSWVEDASGLLLKGLTLLFLPDLVGLRGVWPVLRGVAVPLSALVVLSTVVVLFASAGATALVGRCVRRVDG